MNFKDLQRILKDKEEVIICTFDGIERRILTEHLSFSLDMQFVFLKKLKLNIRDISRVKKVENKKDEWVLKTLEYKKDNNEELFLIGEDFQVKGKVNHLDEHIVTIDCTSFQVCVAVKLDKITSIY